MVGWSLCQPAISLETIVPTVESGQTNIPTKITKAAVANPNRATALNRVLLGFGSLATSITFSSRKAKLRKNTELRPTDGEWFDQSEGSGYDSTLMPSDTGPAPLPHLEIPTIRSTTGSSG